MDKSNNTDNLSCVLLVDKPSGKTSHDIVDIVRKKFKIKKVGHAGTLDPMATGLLVLLLGKATKKSKDLVQDNKGYHAVVSFGRKTDTMDATGKVTEEADLIGIDIKIEDLEKALEKFAGDMEQVPPMYSAIKHEGKRLYKLARKGIEVERKPRLISIYRIEILDFKFPDVKIEIECSKGTYVRVLCEQIGDALGVPAHMSMLRRITSGDFNLKNAVTLEQLDNMSSLEELKKTDACLSWD